MNKWEKKWIEKIRQVHHDDEKLATAINTIYNEGLSDGESDECRCREPEPFPMEDLD